MEPKFLNVKVDRVVQVTEKQWVLQESDPLWLKFEAWVLLEKLVGKNQEYQRRNLFGVCFCFDLAAAVRRALRSCLFKNVKWRKMVAVLGDLSVHGCRRSPLALVSLRLLDARGSDILSQLPRGGDCLVGIIDCRRALR